MFSQSPLHPYANIFAAQLPPLSHCSWIHSPARSTLRFKRSSVPPWTRLHFSAASTTHMPAERMPAQVQERVWSLCVLTVGLRLGSHVQCCSPEALGCRQSQGRSAGPC